MAQDRQPERREPPGHGSTNRGRRGLAPAVAAVVLLAMVAMGSLHGPLGSGRGRPTYPADLIDSLLLLLLLAMVAAGVLAIVSLWPDRHLLGERRRRAGSLGLLVAVELVADRATRAPFPRRARVTERVLAAARDRGLLLYSSTGCVDGTDGDLVMLGPPLVATDAEIDEMVELTTTAVEAAMSDAQGS